MGARLTQTNVFIANGRRDFASERANFYSAHQNKPLIDEFDAAIAKMERPDMSAILARLRAGNERMRSIVDKYVAAYHMHRPLEDPKFGDYSQADITCVASQSLVRTAYDYLEAYILPIRTAGSIARGVRILKGLAKGANIFVISHSECGAERVAYNYYANDGERDANDHKRLIAEGISLDVAIVEDSSRRTMINARHQAETVKRILEGAEMIANVYLLMHILEYSSQLPAELLHVGKQPDVPDTVDILRENTRLLWKIAKELGRKKDVYAYMAVAYDPRRLGRFNDPQIILDLLPREAICVAVNFDDVLENRISPLARGSLEYGLESVPGIGNNNGTRLIMIIDPDPATAAQVKNAIVDSSERLRDLTKGGETIMVATYDLATRQVKFEEAA